MVVTVGGGTRMSDTAALLDLTIFDLEGLCVCVLVHVRVCKRTPALPRSVYIASAERCQSTAQPRLEANF